MMEGIEDKFYVILGLFLDLLDLLIGDVFYLWNEFVLKIDIEKELFYFEVLLIYKVVMWLLVL